MLEEPLFMVNMLLSGAISILLQLFPLKRYAESASGYQTVLSAVSLRGEKKLVHVRENQLLRAWPQAQAFPQVRAVPQHLE